MRRNVDKYLKLLDSYFEQRQSDKLGVPESSRTPGKWSVEFIARHTGIPPGTLKGSPTLRERIEEWAKKIGFSPVDRQENCGNGFARKRDYLEKLDAYIARLKREGKRLPENPRCAGTPCWERISSDTGIPVTAFVPRKAASKRIRIAIEEIGLEIYQGSEAWFAVTYGELLDRGSEWREEELKGKKQEKQQLYNTRSKLRYFMKHAGILLRGRQFEEDDVVGAELIEKFEETLRALTKNIGSDSSRRTFSRQARRWNAYHLRICRSRELPPAFIDALEAALVRAGKSAEQLAEAANVDRSKLYAWLNKDNNPALESSEEIRRIEDALSLPAGTLTSRIIKTRPKHFPKDVYPEYVFLNNERVEIRGKKGMRDLLRPLLPDDFDEWTGEKRAEAATWLIKNLLTPATDWRRWYREINQLKYSMKALPLVAAGEFKELGEFKKQPLPPRGMKRSESWCSQTESIRKKDFLKFFGYLSLPRDAEDPRSRGLGLDPELFTLALLTQPGLVDGWIRWGAMRRRKQTRGEQTPDAADDAEKDSFSFFDVALLESIIDHVTPGTGWLRQKPELADHLKPIPGFIDETFIARARADWDGVCGEALEEYENLASTLEDVAVEQRDPFEDIIPLLDVDHPHYQNPILALRTFAQTVLADMPNPALAPVMAARHLKRYLIVRILSATALRSRNIRELTFREDNTGQLRRKGNRWEVVISHKRFKNWNSSFFGTKKKRHDYVKVLEDTDGLYMWLDEYVGVYRKTLLKGADSDVFFYNTPENPVIGGQEFHKLYRRLTMRYLAHNPYLNRGVPGVRPHGPHAVRDILATFIIQQTGSYELAAYILTDSVKTVREHYTKFVPKDKTRMVSWILNAAWNGEVISNFFPSHFPPQALGTPLSHT